MARTIICHKCRKKLSIWTTVCPLCESIQVAFILKQASIALGIAAFGFAVFKVLPNRQEPPRTAGAIPAGSEPRTGAAAPPTAEAPPAPDLPAQESGRIPFPPGTPVLAQPGSPQCLTGPLLDRYIRAEAAEGRKAAERLLSQGCRLIQEELPLTVVEASPSGILLALDYRQGYSVGTWVHARYLKPYQSK